MRRPRHSAVLAKLAMTDDRIDEYEFDPNNDMGAHWIHLADGWICEFDGTHSIHDVTVAECLWYLKAEVEKCYGDCCTQTKESTDE